MQSKLFPQYFMLQTAGSAIALATLWYSGTGVLKPQLYALGECCSIAWFLCPASVYVHSHPSVDQTGMQHATHIEQVCSSVISWLQALRW
jgi:hypothetical protein